MTERPNPPASDSAEPGMRPFEAVPKHVAIELTSLCNRDCWFCPRWGDRSGKRKDADGNPIIRFMPTEHVVPLMQQVWDMGYRGAINFHHLSEPFLDKRLVPFARQAKEMGFSTIIHTNGDVLRANADLARAAAEAFDEITIGLYDYTSEDERIAEEAFWMGYLPAMKRLHFTRHEIVFPRHGVNPQGPRMANAASAIELARQHPCEQVREHLIIHYDGNIALCCEDYPDQFGLGNAFDTPLRDIWWGARRREVLDILSRPGGRLHFPHCAVCPFAPTQNRYKIAAATSDVVENENVFPAWERVLPEKPGDAPADARPASRPTDMSVPGAAARFVDLTEIKAEQGRAWLVVLPEDIPSGDDEEDNFASDLRLFEDGVELLPAHAQHKTIREEGTGHYSHWRRWLWFSTPDGSDPRSNGRRYQILVPPDDPLPRVEAQVQVQRRAGDSRRLAPAGDAAAVHADGAAVPFFVHLGYPKTATTTLQTHLFPHHSEIDYVGKFIPGFGFVKGFPRLTLDALMTQPEAAYAGGERLGAWIAERRRLSAGKAVLLSSESFLHVTAADTAVVAARLREAVPDARIIITLREQKSFLRSFHEMHGAFGQYLFVQKDEREDLTFPLSLSRWLELQLRAPARNLPGLLYYDGVVRLFAEAFGRERVGVFLFEDLAVDAEAFADTLSTFLGIDPAPARTLIRGRHENPGRHGTGTDGRGERSVFLSPVFTDPLRENIDRTLPEALAAHIDDLYREGNRRLAEEWDLPLAARGYAC